MDINPSTYKGTTLLSHRHIYIGGGYVDDWMIEVIASKLGKQLGFNIVNQESCIIKENRGIVKIYGVASDNFETESIHFVSIKRLLGED